MVGVGPNGSESALARVSLVNYAGLTVMDEYVRPVETITDYRTFVSGIRPEHMVHGPYHHYLHLLVPVVDGKLYAAKSFREVQAGVAALLKDRFLVGHALHNDLTVLFLSHPPNRIRDTQAYAPFRKGLQRRTALRTLVMEHFGLKIQEGEHSSVSLANNSFPWLFIDVLSSS